MDPGPPLRILLVEDDPGMAVLAADRLGVEAGWTVTTAASAAACRAQLAERPADVVLLDRGLPDCDGASLISELLAAHPEVAIVMLTGADSAASATESLRLGAWDYVVKQPDLKYLDALPAVIRRCAERIAWRREEARLRGEVNLLLTAIRSAADAVIMVDGDGRVRFWNAAAEQLFGWRAEEVQGGPLPVIPRERQGEFAVLRDHARRGHPLIDVETVAQRRDGSLAEISLTLTAVRNGDGSVGAYVTVARDIRERKQLECARRDFAAMLTHDIRNPLAAIRGFAALLDDGELTPDSAELVAGIKRAAETIDRLVADFLISSTIEAGTLELARERVPADPLVDDCVRQFRAAAAHKQITLQRHGAVGGVFVCGDRLQLERALGNLVANAIKYTPAGGAVTVEAGSEGATLRLTVRDTGPGISPEQLPFVFDKYRRLKGGEHIDGAGLGLYVVRSLVEAHGGRVWACSEAGAGSAFTIELPADRADRPREPSAPGASGPGLRVPLADP